MREAIIYAFDFEWTNKTIMYGAYERTRLAVPEFRHDGEGQAVAGGTQAARALPRPGAGRGIRRAVRAAGLRWSGQDRALLRKAPQLLRRPGSPSRTASGCRQGRGLHHRIPDRRAVVPAAPRALHQESRRGSASTPASGWSIPSNIARACEAFDFDITMHRLSISATPGDSLRPYFTSQAAAHQGSYNLAGIADPASTR